MNVTDKRKNDQFKHIEDGEPFEYEGFIYMKLSNPYKILHNNGAIFFSIFFKMFVRLF